MDTELAEHFMIIKGYIDAKDEQLGTIYGVFLGVASRRDMRYLRVAFGPAEIPKDIGYDELRTLLEGLAKGDRPPAYARSEEDLRKFFEMSRVLQGIARNLNVKNAEQTISRFCADELHRKSVTFIEFIDASEADLLRFLPSDGKSAEATPPPSPSGEEAQPEGEGAPSAENREARDIVVRCDPVLDPVHGVAMAELTVGSYVYARLPGDSAFYKLFLQNFQEFDGVIKAQVSGVLVNELGTATVSLQLADGVSGVMKMLGKVKVRMSEDMDAGGRRGSLLSLHALPIEVIFGLASIFVLLSIIWLIVYLTE